jgi:hypothetical protein
VLNQAGCYTLGTDACHDHRRYNTSDCSKNCTIYTPKCQCSGTAAKPGHCIAAVYNVSIHPCGDPAFDDKQQWVYDPSTQHMKLKNSGDPGKCMIACGISWAVSFHITLPGVRTLSHSSHDVNE